MSDLIYRQDAVSLPVMPKRYRHYMSFNLDDVYEKGWEDLQLCIEHMPSAQSERKKGQNDQPESAKEYCAECDHIEMCGWYPYEGCEFRSIPQPERKQGKWITVNGRLGNEVECDKCHSVFWYWMGNYRFCPSCGADMRGDSNG